MLHPGALALPARWPDGGHGRGGGDPWRCGPGLDGLARPPRRGEPLSVLYAEAGVPGFALDLTGADADLAGNTVLPAYGRPTCADWWRDSINGLRARMASFTGPATLTACPPRWRMSLPRSPRPTARMPCPPGARALATERDPAEKIVGTEAGEFQQAMQAVPDVVGIGGMLSKAFEAQSSKFPIIQFATMAPAADPDGDLHVPAADPGLWPLQPAGDVHGRAGDLHGQELGGDGFIARWLDEHLMVAMYPDAATLLHTIVTLDADATIKRTTLNTLLVGLYVGLPLIWSAMMGWIGLNITRGLDLVQARRCVRRRCWCCRNTGRKVRSERWAGEKSRAIGKGK